MALQKDYNYKGIIANYWKILDYKYESLSDETIVTIGVYLNKEARDANKLNFIDRIVLEVKGENKRDGLYVELKNKKQFANSLDI